MSVLTQVLTDLGTLRTTYTVYALQEREREYIILVYNYIFNTLTRAFSCEFTSAREYLSSRRRIDFSTCGYYAGTAATRGAATGAAFRLQPRLDLANNTVACSHGEARTTTGYVGTGGRWIPPSTTVPNSNEPFSLFRRFTSVASRVAFASARPEPPFCRLQPPPPHGCFSAARKRRRASVLRS